MRVLVNIAQLATCRAEGGQGDIHTIPDAAMVWDADGVIRWVGREKALPPEYRSADRVDAGRRLVIPGLIDCHTHLAFAGWRADEFEHRIQGRSYLDIARAGGGIASTVRQTRAASESELLQRSRGFLEQMRALGVTTVECKSGYGLEPESELKLLRVYRSLAQEQPTRIVPTFLAHVIPPEFRQNRTAYVDLITNQMIPVVSRQKLAVSCDVFVEESAFTIDEARRILQAAQKAGLGARLHADQLSSSGGAELAAELRALSADHLEFISEQGIKALASAGVVAVSLPLASLYLGQQAMPARRLIGAGIPVAVATDFNPGSAPSYHLPLALTLGCTLQRMTPSESLKGATCYAARAVGLDAEIGSLEPGKAADFAIMDAPDVSHWLYHFRPNACLMTSIGGIARWSAPAA